MLSNKDRAHTVPQAGIQLLQVAQTWTCHCGERLDPPFRVSERECARIHDIWRGPWLGPRLVQSSYLGTKMEGKQNS